MTSPGCLDPTKCPVPSPKSLGRKKPRLTQLDAGLQLFRVYELRYGYDAFNPGKGNSRFAPLQDATGAQVATLYAGQDPTVALLETIFHEVGVHGDRIIYARALRDRGLAHIALPDGLRVADLRDAELARLGLTRNELVATDAAHYACTREWASWLHALTWRQNRAQGIIWHSRKAELIAGPPLEAVMLFGDRVPTSPGSYPLAGPGVLNLLAGRGRLLVDEIVENLDAMVEPL